MNATKLGSVQEKHIKSSIGPLHVLPDYRTIYPVAVVHALGQLFVEYNRAFGPLVAANRENETDYQYAMGPDATPVNFAVQIDMVGLSEPFLEEAAKMTVPEVRELLRGQVFEIENSLAMYQLLERVFAREGQASSFRTNFRTAHDDLRQRFRKPIALLAVTDQKHEAMRQIEFGKQIGEPLSDDEVRELSGFDHFFGPEDFKQYLVEHDGECGYMLYVRSSDPVEKLKKPGVMVDQPLLGNPVLRRIIKANAITFNIDDPSMEPSRRINDTKGYMASMGMGFQIAEEVDLLSAELQAHLAKGKPFGEFDGASRLSLGFVAYLKDRGVDLQQVESGKMSVRAKPLKGTYGCYGHISGPLPDGKFRGELRRNMRLRGGYVIQPELETPRITNSDGTVYMYIDRNFFGFTNGEPRLLGGFRSLMPIESEEAKKGRVHGNGDTVWAEIVSE